MKINKKFCIVTSFYNQEHRIINCIEHSLAQDFEDLGLILYSDGSTDTSHTKILSYFPSLELVEGYTNLWHTISNGVEVLYKRSSERNTCASYNIQQMVKNHIENDDCIIGIVDGDDYLNKKDACSVHYNAFKVFPCAPVIVSSIACETQYNGEWTKIYNMHSHDLRGPDDEWNNFGNSRKKGFFCYQMHFKTFIKRLSDLVPREYFEDDNGNLMGAGADVAYFNTMMEIVDDFSRFAEIGFTGYRYTSDDPRRDSHKTEELNYNSECTRRKRIHPYIYVPKADWQQGTCQDVDLSAEKEIFERRREEVLSQIHHGPTGNSEDLYDEEKDGILHMDKQWLKDELGIVD